MARMLRVQFEGAIYHVTLRGVERRAIFRDDRDRQRFLGRLNAVTWSNAWGSRTAEYGYLADSDLLAGLAETNSGLAISRIRTSVSGRIA